MSNLIPVEFKNQRIITTKVLAEEYGTNEQNISKNFNRNQERFIEGKHYYKLEGEELKHFKGYVLNDESLKFVSVLYLWTERGAARHAKILDTDEAWDVYEELEETYFRVKVGQTNIEGLSPQLQTLINLELGQKKLEEKIETVREENKNEIQAMRDVVAINTTNWRADCKNLIVKIAHELGGTGYIRDVNNEVYSLMRTRLNCRLDVKRTNMRRRMADEGVCKSKRDKVTYLDVIETDNRLKEGYIAIVKELAIKYGAA